MMMILYTLAALFIFTIIVAPIVIMIILLIRTNKPKNPTPNVKLEQLEENDYTIVEDVNKAFSDVSQSLTELQKRLDEIEEKMEREDSTIKGFNSKR